MRIHRLLRHFAKSGVTQQQMRTAVTNTIMEDLESRVERLIDQAFDNQEPLHEAIMPLQYKR